MSSETYAPDWLALREPVDHRSRAAPLIGPLTAWWRVRPGSRVLDLGSGTGSNLRYLAPRLTPGQEWTLLDHDPTVLERSADIGIHSVAHVAHVERVRGDLAREGIDAIHHADLVTASALLDLVSQSWLDRVVAACRASGCAVLFALTWDGSIEWRTPDDRPGDPDDALVLAAVTDHQRGDKGTGPALGPAAGAAAERAFQAAGFRTRSLPSHWRLSADDAELAGALVDGWEKTASEQDPDRASRIHAWAERRRQDTRSPAFGLVVGHVDLLALPAEGSR